MKRNQPKPVNMLHDIYLHFMDAPLTLRDKICEECSISLPTFYRKIRTEDGPSGQQVLSNAEKECIVKMASLTVKSLDEFLAKYRKDPDGMA